VTVAPEQSSLAARRAAAVRRSVEAIREAAATIELVALTYDHLASAADTATGSPGPHSDRAAWARRRAAEERCEALRMWARAASPESAGN
jgi:hypothetical protein